MIEGTIEQTIFFHCLLKFLHTELFAYDVLLFMRLLSIHVNYAKCGILFRLSIVIDPLQYIYFF